MIDSRSASIDSWNDKPKHPIIVSGANKYFTNGDMITAYKEWNLGQKTIISSMAVFRIFLSDNFQRLTYPKK